MNAVNQALSEITPTRAPVGRLQRDSLLRRTLSPAPRFALLDEADEQRAEAEAYVSERYQGSYQAALTQFLPWLLSMRCLGSLSGVAGLGPATDQPLFLERYLQAGVEQLISQQTGTDVARGHIVEIGNLAADQRGASHLLFVLFTAILHRAGYHWITFTATRALRNNLDKLGFPLVELGSASIEHLDPAQRAAWGRYYDTDPRVMAGSLDEAWRIMQERPLLRRVLRLYRYDINFLAELLKRGQ
jgi:hypothetical protein